MPSSPMLISRITSFSNPSLLSPDRGTFTAALRDLASRILGLVALAMDRPFRASLPQNAQSFLMRLLLLKLVLERVCFCRYVLPPAHHLRIGWLLPLSQVCQRPNPIHGFCAIPVLPLLLQVLTIEPRLRAVHCKRACVDPIPVIKTKHSVLPPKGKPEFHAEWLRDKPCDATTTCPPKNGSMVSTLARRRGT